MNKILNNKVVTYLQTQESLDILPKCYPNLTAINVASFHFGFTSAPGPIVPYIHLNDNVPEDPIFDTLWKTMSQAQSNGVLVIAMLGGAGGAYGQLFGQNDYDIFYPMLVKMLRKYNFDGIDLDVEEQVSQADITRLIDDLRKDFPNDFYITSAPVCSALQTGSDSLSGINWFQLKDKIDWFNVQFYSGFGTLSNESDYITIINQGYSPNQIVGGALTNPSNGYGYVSIQNVMNTLKTLNTKYEGNLGGAMGWEYYNSNDSSETVNPEGWCSQMKQSVSVLLKTV